MRKIAIESSQRPVCWLTCEQDEDCPAEMACLGTDVNGSGDLGFDACWVIWAKPDCCEYDPDSCS